MSTRILLGEDLEDLPSNTEKLPAVEQLLMLRHDRRTVDSPTKLPPMWGKTGTEAWFSEGKHHRVEDGKIVRSFETTGFFIQVEDLADLTKLLRENTNLDLSYDRWCDELRLQETE